MLTLKASRHAYIALGLISWMPSFLIIFRITELIAHPVFPGVFKASMAATVVFFTFLYFFKITVTDNTVSYRCLLGGTKTINRSEIERYEIKIGQLETLHDRIKPFVRLNIFTNNQKEPSLEINLKVFNHKELQSFFKLLDSDIQKNTN